LSLPLKGKELDPNPERGKSRVPWFHPNPQRKGKELPLGFMDSWMKGERGNPVHQRERVDSLDPIQCACLLISISSRKRKNKERVSLRPGRVRAALPRPLLMPQVQGRTDRREIPVTQVTFTGCYTKLTEAPRLSLRLPNHPILFQNALSRRTALRWGGYFLFLNWGYFFFLNWCYFLNNGKSLQDPCLSFLASSAWIPVSLL